MIVFKGQYAFGLSKCTLGSEAKSSTMGCFRTKDDVKPLQMA